MRFAVDTLQLPAGDSGLAQGSGSGKVGAGADVAVEADNAGVPAEDAVAAGPGLGEEGMAFAEAAEGDQRTADGHPAGLEDIDALEVIHWDKLRSLVQDSPEVDVVVDEVGTGQRLDRLDVHIL